MATRSFKDLIFMWCKLTPESADKGDPNGARNQQKIAEKGGQYTVDCYFKNEEAMEAFRTSGIEMEPMKHPRIKDGDSSVGIGKFFKASVFVTDEKEIKGEVIDFGGQPRVIYADNGEKRYWDWSEDGLIGNGSEGSIRVEVYSRGAGFRLTDVLVTTHVEYEGASDPDFDIGE